jgi:hypothetical protein
MKIEKNFQIVRLGNEQAKQLIDAMKRLGDKGFEGSSRIEGAKGPSGTSCSHTNAGLEPIGRADFECDDSD